MKTITHVTRPCDCHGKLRAHAEAQKTPFYLGTIVECDCGQLYKLADDQRDGPYWRAIAPGMRGVSPSISPPDILYGLQVDAQGRIMTPPPGVCCDPPCGLASP